MQKVPGVSSVRVSLNDGLTILDFAPSNTVTLANLRQVIRNNGFVTKEAKITARGAVTASGSTAMFEVSGSRERLTVVGHVGPSADAIVTGTVDLSDPKSFKIAVTDAKAP